MKRMIQNWGMASFILVLSVAGGPVLAQQGAVVFECKAEVQGHQFAMKVVDNGAGQLESYFVGSSYAGPEATSFQVLSLDDALRMSGVVQIARDALKLRAADVRKEVDTVHVYTAESSPGSFDDDASGVRSVIFLKKSGEVMGKGMAFGWAGPMKCKN